MATLTRNGHVVINGRDVIRNGTASDPDTIAVAERLTMPGRDYHWMTHGRPVGHDTKRTWTMPDDSLTPREEEAITPWIAKLSARDGLKCFSSIYQENLSNIRMLQSVGIGAGRNAEEDACDITAAVNRVLGSPHA